VDRDALAADDYSCVWSNSSDRFDRIRSIVWDFCFVWKAIYGNHKTSLLESVCIWKYAFEASHLALIRKDSINILLCCIVVWHIDSFEGRTHSSENRKPLSVALLPLRNFCRSISGEFLLKNLFLLMYFHARVMNFNILYTFYCAVHFSHLKKQ